VGAGDERPALAHDLEQDWVVRVGRGDSSALEEMFSAYGPRLCAFAHRWTRSRETAEEIVQDVFLAIWRNRAEWRLGAGMLKPYLFRATRNRVTNDLRRVRVAERFAERAVHEDFDGAVSRPSATPDEDMRQAELRRSVHEAVTALPDRCREIFLLNREQGLTYAEIAGLLGVTVKTVEYHMARAFVALRARLADWNTDARGSRG
jgi:RNA polymerase sigma-70 factor (ECF subfamily)